VSLPRTAAAPRIEPGDRHDLGTIGWLVATVSGLATGTTTPNLFLTLGRHRRLFRGWLRFAGRLMPGGTLPRRETELVILRVARLRACAYEAEHHRRLGKRAGLTDTELDRVAEGPTAVGWSAREATVLAAVDALHDHGDLDDEQWTRLREHLDEREAIELLLLAGHYEMLATVINTLRIEPDRPRRG
jgi:AhpD family alkylhydroperoxidase